MKTLKLFLSLLLLAVIVNGCSSSSEQCVPIVCQNNGISNPDCGCNCPEGYIGADCSTRKQPTLITITKIKVTMFPNTNNGVYWDAFNGLPDISVMIGRQNNTTNVPDILYTSTIYYPDVLSTGSNSFDFVPTTPIVLNSTTTPHVIELFDYDGADTVPSADDTMGVIAFYPYKQENGFPAVININDDTLPLRFELSVTYTF